MTVSDFHKFYLEHEAYVRKCLFWVLNSQSVDEVVQEVFLKIWKKQSTFKNHSQLRTWIYRIAINSAYDHIRKNKRLVLWSRESPSMTSLKSPVGEGVSDAGVEESIMYQTQIQRALNFLSEKQRSVFVLYYIEELSVEEVAEVLEIAVGTVKSRLFGAREIVVEELKKSGINF